MTRAEALRRLMSAPPVLCLGVYDAMTSKLAEAAGAKALYVSGYAASAVRLGEPDLGLISQTEMADHIGRICGATSLPVIADSDTGYGGIAAAERTVRLWEQAGAAGLHMEDQVFPKRCGHVTGKQVIPTREMVLKLKAACAARTDPDFVIISRTDAIAVTGLADALDRCKAYADAGADVLFLDAPESEAQLVAIDAALRPLGKPLLFNSARTLKSPVLPARRLAELGYGVVIFPIEALMAAHKLLGGFYRSLAADGDTEALASQMTTFRDFNEFIGMTRAIEAEQRLAAE